MPGDLKSEFIKFIRYRFNLEEDKANEGEIIENIRKNIEFSGPNLWALIFAILIASIGLNVNSTAVIIGAMLISPLMGPIMGIGLGAGIFDFGLIRHSAKNLAIATLFSLITSAAYFSISPLHFAHSEILARTTPTIWDVLIAFFGGTAGIIASSRKHVSNVIQGVAIATALMPPLCTAGFGIGTGHLSYFLGAFYLYIINCVFISISTFLIIRFLKFRQAQLVDRDTERKVKKYVWLFAILTILPSLYLAYRFVGEEIFKQNAEDFINRELRQKNLYVINKSIDAAEKKVELIVYGEEVNDSTLNAILERKKKYGLENSDIVIRHAIGRADYREALAEIKSGPTDELYVKQIRDMAEKDRKIDSLNRLLLARRNVYTADSALLKEFNVLFGETKALLVFKAPVTAGQQKPDTVLYLYYTPLLKKQRIDEEKVKKWLSARTNIHTVKIFRDK